MLLKQIDCVDHKIELVFDEFTTEINIGRGPLLKISDTKLSRKQAQIIKINGSDTYELSIVNTGKSCYFKLKDSDEWNVVESKVELENESYFSLLPEKYIFQVILDKNEKLDKDIEAEKISENKDNIDEEQDISDNQPSTSSPVKNENSAGHNNPDLENTNSTNISSNPTTSSSSSSVQRSNCPYGSDCNRKNPMHFQSEAHPGDLDYREEPQQNSIDPENDPRPECEYGLDCYRKNPQHKLDFKHTFNPRPKRRVKDKATAKAKKAKKSPTTNDEEDYDSSFIDDNEDDTDEADISNDEESVDEWTPDDDDDY